MSARPSAPLAIETHSLSKKFGGHAAVDQVDLAVPEGAVFGFLGPNGSGKTTTIRMLLGLVAASEGQISVLGHAMPTRLKEVLPRVGALVEGPAFAPFLSGEANLARLDTADRYAASATRRARVHRALDRVGLGHAAKKHVRAYSLGMKQRLGIAGALLAPRELLVLDEPTNGLDPQGTREVRALIRSFADEGATVFVSSHLLSEVEQLCTHAAILSAGRLVAQGSLNELRRMEHPQVALLTPDAGAARSVLITLGLVPLPHAADADPEVVTAEMGEQEVAPEAIIEQLVSHGVRVRGFTVQRASLEDRFVALTGEGFDIVQ